MRRTAPKLLRHLSSDSVDSVRVGRAVTRLRGGGDFKPVGALATLPPRLGATLEWLCQKDALGQDALLICAPAERARARRAAFAFAELVNAEAFYVGVSPDTAEADLRQRRELTGGGSAAWSDAAPVRAALAGGVLILDGLERAERNVLPTLNNLLENRELALDDGRRLVPEWRLAQLREEVDVPLLPVPQTFRVIALASPAPPFTGRALDPPLRSRLQAHVVPSFDVDELPPHEDLAAACAALVEIERANAVAAAASRSSDTTFAFSGTAIKRVARHAPDARAVLERCYPPLAGRYLLGKAVSKDAVEAVDRVLGAPAADEGAGRADGALWLSATQSRALAAAQSDLKNGEHVALVGPAGGGKSIMAARVAPAARLQTCHKDLTARDLLQSRATDPATGASTWRDGPIIEAMRAGSSVILDGAHRLQRGVLAAALSRALHDGIVDLPDGSRLEAAEGFRVVAVAEPGTWLGEGDVAACFSSHVVPEWADDDIEAALAHLVPGCDARALAAVARRSREDGEAATRLSIRSLLRVARRLAAGEADVKPLVEEALMAAFLPRRLRDKVDDWFASSSDEEVEATAAWTVAGEDVSVVARRDGATAATVAMRGRGRAPELVPSLPNYVPTRAAEAAVAALVQLEAAGERAVLVLGNQGVGKNVAVDRYLSLCGAEREYSQLHRDSTVSSLTATPTLEDGILRHEDAPLVRAALHGRVCVLDEADKAPTEVTVLLKALVADGVLPLPDGRILRVGDNVHADFRLVVLANRPGYPFHGNALFRECGDAFAGLVVDNPDVDSEVALLEDVAPSRPHDERRRLACAFAELRARHETGSLAYPFSMRECAAVARHLELYGSEDEGVGDALANVLAHDAYAPQRAMVAAVFEAHGFEGVADKLQRKLDGIVPSMAYDVEYTSIKGSGGASVPRTGLSAPKFGKVDPSGNPHVGGNTWAGGSGGSDTAGLGGRGGPYRLWDGKHVPHQVSDEAKAEVSEAARAEGRRQAQIAHKQRLEEIEGMTENEWDTYKGMLDRIAPHVASLREQLGAAKDRKSERTWLRRRSDGELDDDRLVDGAAGERLVFKRRGKPDPLDRKPTEEDEFRKRTLLFLVDVSGSMYRFQMMDGRLARMLEATMLVMEALEGLEGKYEYAIRGHSGESDGVEFVEFGQPPSNRGERLKVLQRMVAHSQFCDTGDRTIEATRRAISDVSARGFVDDEEERKHLVVALSDANFSRYGLDPRWWAEALSDSDAVDAHAVMVGSIADEASLVAGALPRGRGHVCFDADELPVVFKRILQHARIIDDGEEM